MSDTLFGHPLPELPPYVGLWSEAQQVALQNICEGFGQVVGDIAVLVLAKQAKYEMPLSKAEASQLIEWAQSAPKSAWKFVAHRAADHIYHQVAF